MELIACSILNVSLTKLLSYKINANNNTVVCTQRGVGIIGIQESRNPPSRTQHCSASGTRIDDFSDAPPNETAPAQPDYYEDYYEVPAGENCQPPTPPRSVATPIASDIGRRATVQLCRTVVDVQEPHRHQASDNGRQQAIIYHCSYQYRRQAAGCCVPGRRHRQGVVLGLYT